MSSFFFDPTVLFTFLCILLPIALEINEPNFAESTIHYLSAPPFLVCSILICFLEFNAPRCDSLTRSEYMVSRWYLLNGLFYHSLMDPICGFLQNWSLMTKQYNHLDVRFSKPFDVGSESATLTVWLEAAIMCPGCIALFYGYRYLLPNIKPDVIDDSTLYASFVWVHCLEFVVCLCQSLGTYFFYGSEMMLLLRGERTNMPYARSLTELDFDLWECFYFWFGTVAMIGVWIIVPMLCICRAYREIVNMISDLKNKAE